MTTDLGYYFHLPENEQQIGPHKFEFNLYKEPTEQHFDPEKGTLNTVGSNGTISRTNITHPYQGVKELPVAVGHVILTDRHDKVVEAFTLGGTLTISNQQKYTHCELTSTAPILDLTDEQGVAGVLVSEFEALLAKKRAEWDNNNEFEAKLAAIDPRTLMVSGLAAIQQRLQALPSGGQTQETLEVIDETIEKLRLQGAWPRDLPDLEALL